MRGLLQISGLLGIVLLCFALVAYLFSANPRDAYVLAHLGLGGLFFLAYLATHGGALIRSLTRRATRRGLRAALYSVLFVAALVLINYLSLRYHARWDLTEAKVHTLSPQSAKVLDALEREVEIFAFLERAEHPGISGLLRRYANHSPRIKFHPVDPERHPELARRFHIQQPGTLHVRYGEESINVTEATEEAITNAIARLSRGQRKSIYFVTGHGEPATADRETNDGYGAAKEALEHENYRVRDLLLAAQARVPQEAALVIVAGPRKRLLDHELEALQEYLKNGGRLLVLLPSREGESLKGFLRDWGVATGDDLVLDQVVRLFAGPSLGVQPIAETYSPSHPITRDFKERTIFPMVRSVEPDAPPKGGIKVSPLVKTSSSSWAERDVAGIFQHGKASLGPEDKKGPVSIAVAVSADLKQIGAEKGGEAKLVVLGTAEFANNRFLDIFFNRDFLLNAVNWLAGEDAFLTIRSRFLRPSRAQLTQAQGKLIFYLSFLIVPELIVLVGLAVWWKRR